MSSSAVASAADASAGAPAAVAAAAAAPIAPRPARAAPVPAAPADGDGDDAPASLLELLPATARSRPVLWSQPISLSTTQSRRTRLTVIEANSQALLVAASSGILYAYQKPNPALLLQTAASGGAATAASPHAASRVGLLKLITRTKDAITHIKFCPTHDDIVAVATSSNQLLLLDLRLSNLKEKENLLFTLPGLPPLPAGVSAAAAAPGGSADDGPGHRDRISCLCWDASGTRLISGDRSGVVICSRPFGSFATPAAYLASLSASTSSFFAKKLNLRDQASVVMRAESEVVQMVCVEGGDTSTALAAGAPTRAASGTATAAATPGSGPPPLLLAVSTLTRCVVLSLSKPGPVVSVGTKARNGPFGVCTLPQPDGARPVPRGTAETLLASRPGKRIWSADLETGQVLSTLKLKLPSPSLLQPFALPSGLPPPPNAAAVQLYHLHPFQHGLVSYYSGDAGNAGGLVGAAPASAPPASPFLCFIDPHHVLIHELVDMGGAVRHVAAPPSAPLVPRTTKDRAAVASAEIWVLHEPPPAAAPDASNAAAAAAPGDAEGALQVSVLLAYPADHFLAHAMKLTPALFPSVASLSPGLLAPHPSLPLLPSTIAGLFPAAVASTPFFQPPLEFFVRLAVRHHVHDRGLLTLLRQRMTEPGDSAAGGVDEALMKAFEELIDEAEHMERLRESVEEEPVPEALTTALLPRQHSAPVLLSSASSSSASNTLAVPTAASKPATPSIPSSPTLSSFSSASTAAAPPSKEPLSTIVTPSHTSSIENLLSKAAQSLMPTSFRSNALGVPEGAPARTVTPDPSAAANATSAVQIPIPASSTTGRMGTGSLSSSPHQAAGSFLPPANATAAASRSARSGAAAAAGGSASANPFTSLPPPMHPASKQQTPVLSVPATSPQSGPAASPPPPSNAAAAASTPTSSTSSAASAKAASFFKAAERSAKVLLQDVSNEWNGIEKAAPQAAVTANNQSATAAAAAAAPAQTSATAPPSSASTGSSGASPDLSLQASPSFAKAAFLPASGHFAAPILSPMLESSRSLGASSETGAGGEADATSSAAEADGTVLKASASTGGGTAGGKKRRKRAPAEVALIARAPAKLLPTPFQPEPSPVAAAATASSSSAVPGAVEGAADSAAEGSVPGAAPEGVPDVTASMEAEDAALEAAAAAALSPSASGFAARAKAKKEKAERKRLKKAAAEAAAAAALAADASLSSASASPMPASNLSSPSPLPDASMSSPSPMPVAGASLQDMLDDGIDPADLAADDEGAAGGGEGAAAIGGAEGRGEGEGEGNPADAEGSGAVAVDPFAYIRATVASSLQELEDLGVRESWSTQPERAAFIPVLQQVAVAHGALGAVRRERFGQLGCEPASLSRDADAESMPLLPAFESLLASALADFEFTSASSQSKSRRPSLALSSEEQHLDAFLSAWLLALEQALVEDKSALVGVEHPAAASPAAFSALSARARLFAAALAASQQDTPNDLLTHVQDLLLVVLQLRLRARVLAQLRGDDAASVWSIDDLQSFVQASSSLLHPTSVLSLCSAYELSDLVEQLHRVCTPVGQDGDAKLVEQLLASGQAEKTLQAFQLMRRLGDPMLSLRCMRSCFTRGGGGASSNLAHQLPLSLSLDHCVQMYPAVSPWLLAKQLDVKVSLFAVSGTLQRLTNPAQHTDDLVVDFSSAPENLVYHPSFLEASSDPGGKQHLQLQAAPHAMLDRVHQQYHAYLHYLRGVLNTHERARKDPLLVVEYVRLCLCFSRPKHEQVFRRAQAEEAIDDGAAAPQWVPARDSQSSSLWPLQASILSILEQPTVYALDSRSLQRLFAKTGFHTGSLLLYTQQLQLSPGPFTSSERLAVIKQCFLLALCSDDVVSFEACMENMLVLGRCSLEQRVQLWKFILGRVHDMVVSPASGDIAPRALNLRMLLNHLLYSLGSQLAVALLLSAPPFIELCDRANLSASFYEDVLAIAVLRAQQAGLNHALLEQVDSYLWSDRSRNVSSHIRAIYDREMEASNEQQQQLLQLQLSQQSMKGGSHHSRSSSGPLLQSSASATSLSSLSTSDPVIPPSLAPFVSFRGDGDDKSSKGLNRRGASSSSSSSASLQRLNDFELAFELGGGGADAGSVGVHSASAGASGASTTSTPLFYEDLSNQGHWGARIELQGAICSECALPLLYLDERGRATRGYPSLLLFRCGHVYHASCKQQRTCTQCWENQHHALPASA